MSSSLPPSTLEAAEWALITSTWPTSLPTTHPLLSLAHAVVNADFLAVLSDSAVAAVFAPSPAAMSISEHLCTDVESSYEGEMLHLVAGVALLQAFMQLNWTGPELAISPAALVRCSDDAALNTLALAELARAGEPAYHLARHPALLRLAELLIGRIGTHVRTAPWWRLRVHAALQALLDEPVPAPADLAPPLDALEERIRGGPHEGRLILERALQEHRLRNDKVAAHGFVRAAHATGLQYELTGALGKRTKFQVTDVSQLVLLAKSRDDDDPSVADPIPHTSTPTTLERNHDPPSPGPACTSLVASTSEPTTSTIDPSANHPSSPAVSPHTMDKQVAKVPGTSPRRHQMDSGTSPSQAGLSTVKNGELLEGSTGGPLSADVATSQPAEVLSEHNEALPITRPAPGMPNTLPLNDDTLLEHTEFTRSTAADDDSSPLAHVDPNAQPPLTPVDQCILLALCLNIHNTAPHSGLTSEQMAPYVTRVLAHARAWAVHSSALLQRTRLEAARTRTAERATLQLAALADQLVAPDEALAKERLRELHGAPLPPRWALERELGRRYLALGVVRSALELFERLEMWEEAVRCWAALDAPERGAELVRDLLAGARVEVDEVLARGKTRRPEHAARMDAARAAQLMCVLGDLEPHIAREQYAAAWVRSRETSARAAGSLGGLLFSRGEFEESAEWLQRAARIAPLKARTWFLLGCAGMRLERWADARMAFERCTSLDDEDGEAWSNLAAVYMRLGDDDDAGPSADAQRRALTAMRLGLRHSNENWRMWSNYQQLALALGEYAECARALARIVELRADRAGVAAVDARVLGALARVAEADTSGRLRRVVRECVEKSVMPRISSASVHAAHARLLAADGEPNAAVRAYLAALRLGPAGSFGAGADADEWRAAAEEVRDAVEALREIGPRCDDPARCKAQARGVVRTFMGRARAFDGEPEWAQLEALSDELTR